MGASGEHPGRQEISVETGGSGARLRGAFSLYVNAVFQNLFSSGGLWRESFDIPLEIVALEKQNDLSPGDTLILKVLFNGKALPDCPVRYSLSKEESRTDKDGIVHIQIAGRMAVRLCHPYRSRIRNTGRRLSATHELLQFYFEIGLYSLTLYWICPENSHA